MASDSQSTYFGRAGEFFAVSELMLRGWNVAVPVVDVGDDVFVIDDNDKTTFRLQIKSSRIAEDEGSGKQSVSFNLSRKQLKDVHNVELLYMLMIREQRTWTFLVIEREQLAKIRHTHVESPR